MEPFETYEHEGFTIELHYDQDCESPREDLNNGLLLGFPHRNRNIGDEVWDPAKQWAICPDCHRGETTDDCPRCDADGDVRCDDLSLDEVIDHIRSTYKATVVLPVSLYDHSGVSYYVGGPRDPWDSGMVGFILDTPERLDITGFAPKDEADMVRALTAEIETYSMWANGECCGYVIKDRNDDEVESCWGFYGSEAALDAAEAVAAHMEQADELFTLRLTRNEIDSLLGGYGGPGVVGKLKAALELEAEQ